MWSRDQLLITLRLLQLLLPLQLPLLPLLQLSLRFRCHAGIASRKAGAAAATAKLCLPIANGRGLPRSTTSAARRAPLLWAATAAVGPVGRCSDSYGCDFRIRKLFPVELIWHLTAFLLKISVESINLVWEQRFGILKRDVDRSLNCHETFCSIVWDNKCDRMLFRFALFFEAPRQAGPQVTGQLMTLIYLNICAIM